jgi:hypothetical protein
MPRRHCEPSERHEDCPYIPPGSAIAIFTDGQLHPFEGPPLALSNLGRLNVVDPDVVILIRTGLEKVGMYTDGNVAQARVWTAHALDWSARKVTAWSSFVGSDPPRNIRQHGSGIGDAPTAAFAAWVADMRTRAPRSIKTAAR